jgi:hypothetical protein
MDQHLQLLSALKASLPPLMAEITTERLLLVIAPLAGALERQDSLLLEQTQPIRELLLEVLNGQHPDPGAEIRARAGLPPGPSRPLPSSLNSAISATR